MASEKKDFSVLKCWVKSLAITLLLWNPGSYSAMAQDQSNFTQFFLNPYILNSSYAGLDGQPSVSLLYRKQWMTIDGGPTITNLSLHSPLNSRVSAGVNITNDSKGFFNNSTVLFSVAYHVPVQEHSFVRFGISAGGSWNTVDMKKLETVNDPSLGSVLDQNASLSGNAGISFHHRAFNFGVALPSLFSPAYVSENAFTVREVKPFQALVFHASNRFYFNSNKNIFEPYVLFHANTDLPSQFELAGIVHLNHILWAGASYKQYFGISALGGIKLKNSLAIGASYSIQQSGPDELNSPSFEVSLNYLFGTKKRNAPLYSFVNAVKPKEKTQTGAARQAIAARQKQSDAAQKRKEEAAKLRAEQEENRKRAAAEAELKKKEIQAKAEAKARSDKQAEEERKKAVEEKRKQDQEAKEKRAAEEKARRLAAEKARGQRAAQREEETRKTLVVKDIPTVEVSAPQPEKNAGTSQEVEEEPIVQTQVEPGGQLPLSVPQDVPEGHPQHEQEQLQRLQTHAQDPQRPVGQQTPARLRHEIVKRGNHPQELDASEYVIVGVFKSSANAQHFSDGLHSLNFNTQFGQLTPSGLWYVYILKTDDINKARAEQERVSKLFLLRDAWLLTVQP